jgi:hypothetical protein
MDELKVGENTHNLGIARYLPEKMPPINLSAKHSKQIFYSLPKGV